MAYHHGNLRAELLARAETVLAEGGVEALSLRSLARDLGVSHAAPARHFPDRQALLDALAVEGFGRLGAEVAKAASSGESFEDRLTEAALVYVRFATQHSVLLDVMYARKHREPTAELRAASDACAAILLGLFTGREAAVDDPERFSVILLATLHGIAALAASRSLPPAHDPDDLVVDTVRRLLRGSRGGA
ncbi:TetR/AcrR family transcriptional regulator [Streptomyces sp. NBC_01217]|uniref:TetR/AcrR family transcriptional regulator n=1 Tax=Streptomyces sp. NBC_01217 TaxID=2903779 RepID=UPI002E124C3A|nr:TetR/AcrR family transcriptional regulator [Streptomyces sp. NBC_01217]